MLIQLQKFARLVVNLLVVNVGMKKVAHRQNKHMAISYPVGRICGHNERCASGSNMTGAASVYVQ